MKIIVLCLLLASLTALGQSFELKVCSVEDLRRSIENACIRFSRDWGSRTDLGPYGAVMASPPLGVDEIRVLQAARSKRNHQSHQRKRHHKRTHHHARRLRRHKRHREIVTRDYVDKCCNEGCEVDAEVIQSIC